MVSLTFVSKKEKICTKSSAYYFCCYTNMKPLSDTGKSVDHWYVPEIILTPEVIMHGCMWMTNLTCYSVKELAADRQRANIDFHLLVWSFVYLYFVFPVQSDMRSWACSVRILLSPRTQTQHCATKLWLTSSGSWWTQVRHTYLHIHMHTQTHLM